MSKGGYVLIHRKIQDHPAFKNNPMREFVFIKIVMNAEFESVIRRGVALERGQFLTTLSDLSSLTTETLQRLRTHLTAFQHEGMIEVNTIPNKKGTLITVCNYNDFQKSQKTTNKKRNSKSTADHTLDQQTIYRESNESNEYIQREIDLGEPQFTDFYKLYPRKMKPDHAERAWRAATKHTTPQTIMDGLQAQLPDLLKRPEDKRPYPASWLNGGEWKNEIEGQTKRSKEDYANMTTAQISALHGGG